MDILQFFDNFTVCSLNGNVGPFRLKTVTISEIIQKIVLCFLMRKTCLSASQALIRYKLLDSVIEKASGEDLKEK